MDELLHEAGEVEFQFDMERLGALRERLRGGRGEGHPYRAAVERYLRGFHATLNWPEIFAACRVVVLGDEIERAEDLVEVRPGEGHGLRAAPVERAVGADEE